MENTKLNDYITIKPVKSGRVIKVYVIKHEYNQFGKEYITKKLFAECLPSKLKEVLKQADNCYGFNSAFYENRQITY